MPELPHHETSATATRSAYLPGHRPVLQLHPRGRVAAHHPGGGEPADRRVGEPPGLCAVPAPGPWPEPDRPGPRVVSTDPAGVQPDRRGGGSGRRPTRGPATQGPDLHDALAAATPVAMAEGAPGRTR